MVTFIFVMLPYLWEPANLIRVVSSFGDVIFPTLPVSPEGSLVFRQAYLIAHFRRQLTIRNLFFHRFKTYFLGNAEHWADAVCTAAVAPGKAEAK
jgi:hypothetical protein